MQQPAISTQNAMSITIQSKMFYFGVWPDGSSHPTGHFLYAEGGRSALQQELDDFPWKPETIDGRLSPHHTDCRAKTGDFGGKCHCNGTGIPQGLALVHHLNGWTALSFWDRSLDGRGACNSNFFAKGEFQFEEILQMSRERFGPRWRFIKFEIVPLIEDQQVGPWY